MPLAKVLIVVDDKAEVKNLRSSLDKLEFVLCGIANNCTDALRLTRELKPDIILIDTKLNEYEDGIETARTISESFKIPHVYISSDAEGKTVERSKSTGSYGFLLKPVNIRDLNSCLRVALNRFESEQKLAESRSRYFRLADNAKDMVFHLSLESREYVYVNKASFAVTGYSPDEFYVSHKLMEEIIHPDWRQSYRSFISKLINGESSSDFEFQIIHASGKIKRVNQRNVLLKDGHNKPYLLEGIITDITDQRNNEISDRHEEYKIIFESIPVMVLVKDVNNRILKINKAAAEFIGYKAAEMEGKALDVYFPKEAEKYFMEDRKVISSREPLFGIIEEFESNGNGKKILKYDKFPFFDSKGNITGIIVLGQDITHQREVEQKLVEVEQKNSVLIGTIPDLLFEYDSEGRHLDYRAANPADLYTTPDKFLGKTVLEVLPDSMRNDYMDCIKKTLETGKSHNLEYHLVLADCEKDFEARFVKSGNNRVLAIIRDITSKKLDENALLQSLIEKEILLKEIHHRVKNNLQIVSSMLKLQSKYVTDKEALELLKESQNRVQSMALIHQKLYQIGDISHVNFREYIMTVTKYLQHSFGILEDRVKVNINAGEIVMSLDNAIPAGLIINELVSNSLKYAFPKGQKGEINIVVVYDKHNGNYWLSVRDNGIGFQKEINPAKSDTFGLNLVNLLVGQMGGTIEVVQKGGLEFRINFKSSDYLKRA